MNSFLQTCSIVLPSLPFSSWFWRHNWLLCLCTCYDMQIQANRKEKALPSKQIHILKSSKSESNLAKLPLMSAIYLDTKPHMLHVISLLHNFHNLLLTLQKQPLLCVKPTHPPPPPPPPLLPLRWSKRLTEQAKCQTWKMRRLRFCHRSEPSHNHRENEWKALFTASLFFWQPSSHRATSICQCLISVGGNWHDMLTVIRSLL